MAVKKDDYATEVAWDNNPTDVRADKARPSEKETSITAHIVRTVSVSMSLTEMDALVESLGRRHDELTIGQRTIQSEFVAAVEAVRFGME